MQQHPLLQTKLHIPPIQPKLVARPRLVELYDHSPLPEEPDAEAAETLVVELQERFLWETRRK